MEFVSESFELESRSYAEHDFYGSGENMESLDCLGFDLLMSYEIDGLLGTAEQYVDDLLRLYRIQCEAQNVLDDVFIHVVETSGTMEA